MKKALLGLGVLAMSMNLSAQTFSEDFANGIPQDWTIVDNDGLTPNPTIVTNYGNILGWLGSNGMALSTSWYAPAGISDDWMITPAITLPAGDHVLSWESYSPDANYRDGYEVLLSTTDTELASFTTTLFSTDGEETTLTSRSAVISGFGGQTVYIAFRNNSNDKFLLYVDNVVVDNGVSNNIVVNKLNYDELVTSPNPTISVDITNGGIETISSWEATITVNGNLIGTETPQSSTQIPAFASTTINLTTPIPTPAYGAFDVEVEFTKVNTVADEEPGDNIGNGIFYYVDGNSLPSRKVVVEEGTGTWCGWCPRGTVAMEQMAANHSDKSVTIAVHNGDPMTVAEYDSYFTTETGFITGFPGGSVDRVEFPDPGNFEPVTIQRAAVPTPVAVDITSDFNATTRTANLTATVSSKAPLAGNYGVAIVITEDRVFGTGPQWSQVNYYSGGGNGQMNGEFVDFDAAPDPVPFSDIHYDHVAVAVIGSPTGDASIIANPMVIDQEYTMTASYAIPDGSIPSNMHAVAMVINKDTHEAMNADDVAITTTSIQELKQVAIDAYPNPANGVINFNFAENFNGELVVTNNMGQVITVETVAGEHHQLITEGFKTGLYMATFNTENGTQTVRFTVTH